LSIVGSHELAGGLVDASVIGDHSRGEFAHILGTRPGLRELAGVDVDLVRCDHDGRDLRVSRPGGVSPGIPCTEDENNHRSAGKGFHEYSPVITPP
jgi:hypothetical protein